MRSIAVPATDSRVDFARRWCRSGVVFAIVAAAGLILPHAAPEYLVTLAAEIIVWALLAAALDIIFGYTGLLSLGHSTFFGLGMYAVVFWVMNAEGAVVTGFLLAIVVSIVAGWVIGVVAVRFGSHYFIVITATLALITFFLAMSWRDYTGGDDGLSVNMAVTLAGRTYTLLTPLPGYYFAFVVGTALYLAAQWLVRSPVGKVFVAIRENEARAALIGYDVHRYKVLAFAVSAGMAGAAGALYACIHGYASANYFHWLFSARAVLHAVIGGLGTVYGSLLGAAILISVEDLLSAKMLGIYPILVGGILIAIILIAPRGIIGTSRSLLRGRGR